MQIFIGADHRGFKLKEELLTWLKEAGYSTEDCGNFQLDPEDDFPDFAFKVAQKVATKPEAKGIVICGSGVGVSIAANKVKGIRASTAINVEEVKQARAHDDLNVLALSADHTSFEEAKELITAFIETDYSGEERFARRLAKIHQFEADQQLEIDR